MPRVKINRSKAGSSSSSGLKFFLFICILLAAQNSFLLYRNYDKAAGYIGTLFASSDSTDSESDSDSLFLDQPTDSQYPSTAESAVAAEKNKNQTAQKTESEADVKNQAPAVPVSGKIVKVSILNGCGVTGLAGKWKAALRGMSYDVRETDNSKEKYPYSVILCRTDDKSLGYALASRLGISKKNVIPQKNKNIVDIDVTLVLGKDHDKLKTK